MLNEYLINLVPHGVLGLDQHRVRRSSLRMESFSRRWCALLIVLCAWSGLAFAQERSVEVEGEAAPATGQTALTVRQLAIDNALQRAVEIGVGVFLTSETIVKNFELISDKIYKKSSGFARVDKIIDQGERSGRYWVKLTAIVSGEKLRTRLREVIRNFNDPRIGVFLTETVDGKPVAARSASTAISKALVNLGFRVLDQTQLEAKVKRDQLMASLDNPAALKRIAAMLQVDLLLLGTARASRVLDQPGNPLAQAGRVASRGLVEVRLVDALTAQVGWTDQFDNGENDLTVEAAAAAALKASGDAAAESLVPQLTGWIQGALEAVPVFVLKISGFKSFSSYNAFIQKLKTQAGVKNVQERDFNTTLTVIEVEFTGNPDSLAILVERLGLAIINRSNNGREITARVK